MKAEQVNALVIATFSRRMRLELPDGRQVDARIKGRKLRPVCGDTVIATPLTNEHDWLIGGIADRHNVLQRPNLRGDAEVLAANIDQLVVVAAALPAPDWFIVDRYLAAAETMPADALVVYNKTDLGERPAELDVYAAIGYDVIATSVIRPVGLDALAHSLKDRVSVFVGQSGVGKSSLINALSGHADQRVNEISSKFEEGRHTTVNSSMFHVDIGGRVIDSPGVRDYAPAFTDTADIEAGFREIHAAASGCRFSNCRHLREPGCAVKSAVEYGTIDARRLESYRRLLRLTERLKPAY